MHVAVRFLSVFSALLVLASAPVRAQEACEAGWPCPHSTCSGCSGDPVVMHIDTGFRVDDQTTYLELGHPIDCHSPVGGEEHRQGRRLYIGTVTGHCGTENELCARPCSGELTNMIAAAIPACPATDDNSNDGVRFTSHATGIHVIVTYGSVNVMALPRLTLKIGASGLLHEDSVSVNPAGGEHVFDVPDHSLRAGCSVVQVTLEDPTPCGAEEVLEYLVGETENWWLHVGVGSGLHWAPYRQGDCPFE